MTWNYRIIKHDLEPITFFAIHEVYYDKAGNVVAWTDRPIEVIGDNKKEIMGEIKHIVSDSKLPVLVESKLLQDLEKNPELQIDKNVDFSKASEASFSKDWLRPEEDKVWGKQQ